MKIFLKKRKGIAVQIFIIIVTLALLGMLFAVFGEVITRIQTFQQTIFPVGVYDPNTLAFINNIWLIAPFIFLFGLVIWGYLRAQKRDPGFEP